MPVQASSSLLHAAATGALQQCERGLLVRHPQAEESTRDSRCMDEHVCMDEQSRCWLAWASAQRNAELHEDILA